MITTAEIARRVDGDRLPLLTLDEFFDGNVEEESIAPNQWGYRRPPLSEILARARRLEAADDVAWVGVDVHGDTELDEEDGWVAAESLVICTTACLEDLERRLDTESLQSDGMIDASADWTGWVTDVPEVPDGYRLTLLVWD